MCFSSLIEVPTGPVALDLGLNVVNTFVFFPGAMISKNIFNTTTGASQLHFSELE